VHVYVPYWTNMRTKKNYKGETYEVTYEKEFEVKRNYTFKFILRREEDIEQIMMERFGTDIRIQIATIGCVVLFTNLPRVEQYSFIPHRCNANLLDAIYQMIEDGECL